jgi:hypothetical protein
VGRHSKFEHEHVKGETDPDRVKAELDRIRADNEREMDRIRQSDQP